MKRYFAIRKERRDADELLFGGYLTEDNVYVRAYAEPLKGEKHPRDLAPGESTRVAYHLSGEHSGPCRVYCLTEDEARKEGLE
jgi:hypothetical protein